jgi:hypothetical protein
MAVPTYKVELLSNNGSIRKDVTAYVRSVNITRGRSRELDKFEAGTFSVAFDNRLRYFDPIYTSSPYNGYITPRRYIVITSAGTVQFSGYVQDWNLSYDISGDSIAVATGSDAFSYLAQQTLAARVCSSQLSGDRLTTVLTPVVSNIPLGVTLLFDSGRRTLQGDTIAAGTNALEYAQLVERTEGGYFYVSKEGALTFDQAGGLSSPSLVTFTDTGVAGAYNIPYQGIEITYGSELLYNFISISRLSGGTVTAANTASISSYGSAVFTDDGLLFNSDSDSTNRALYLAAKYGFAEYRVDSLTVSMTSLSSTKQTNLMPIDIGVIVKVIFTPNGVTADASDVVSEYVRIIGIDHSMNVDDHIVTYRFESVDRATFILDDAVFGLLDYNVLGF